MLRRNCSDDAVQFEILSNPEFLAEGTAMKVGGHSDNDRGDMTDSTMSLLAAATSSSTSGT